jgi:GT2 family glycosyltransferase
MISIVTSYYNRKEQFYRTLKSIAQSSIKDIELIAVDDGSQLNQRIEEFLKEFLFLKIIRIEPKDKWYVNPCIPFNVGIRAAIGDVIVLQNPECVHVGDVLAYINKNVDDSKYVTISAYALGEQESKQLSKCLENGALVEFFKSLPKYTINEGNPNGWYNHSIHRPEYFHFCAAMTKKNMDLLNGFDERYAKGIACDDAEFVIRIDRLGLKKIIVDEVSVIHQWHPLTYYTVLNAGVLRNNNGVLLNITKNESGYKANNLTINENTNNNGNKT